MARNEFSLVGVFCFIILANCQTQDFLSRCGPNRPCSSEKFLKCLDNQCECEDPDTQIYDPIEGECVILAGRKCSQRSVGVPQCVQGGECSQMNSTCQCSKGFYETQFNICSYNIGKSCEASADCDASSGLVCENRLCKCRNSSYIWQLDLGCVTVQDVIASIPGDVFNATFSPSSNLTSENEISVSSSTTLAPVGINPNPIVNNGISDWDALFNKTSTQTINGTSETNGTEIGDRDSFLENVLGNSPILNLLNPQRRRPNPTFNPQPSFIPNNNNFAPQNNPPQKIQGQVQLQNPQAPQNIQQSSPQQQQPMLDFTQFQRPSNAVPNIFNPPGIENQNIDNPNPVRFPVLHRLFTPLKRYLFPGLENRNFRLPSPIWLTVNTINQALPILRAIDHQVSPWLQTLSQLTRPQDVGLQNGNNFNTNVNGQFLNNNYNNNGQVQNQNNYQYPNQQYQQQQPQPSRQSRYYNFYQTPTRNIFR